MDPRWLESFVAVGEERSFVRAAERVHLGQPAVSQHVRRLESALGVRLFDRTSRRVELTEAGRTLLAPARSVLTALGRLHAAAEELTGSARPVLRLGTSTGLGLRLGAVVSQIAALAPSTEVELVRLRLRERLDAVRAGRLDAAFAPALHHAAGLEVVEAWDEPLYAAVPLARWPSDADSIDLPELRELAVRLAPRRSNPPFRDLMDRLLDQLPDAVHGARFTTLQDVLTDIGSGRAEWTPLYGQRPAAAGVRFLPVTGQRIATGLAVLPGPPTASVRALLSALAAIAADGDELHRLTIRT